MNNNALALLTLIVSIYILRYFNRLANELEQAEYRQFKEQIKQRNKEK